MNNAKKKVLLAFGTIFIICILLTFPSLHKRTQVGKVAKIENNNVGTVKYSNELVDTTDDGVLYIKKGTGRIVTVSPPSFTDINYSKNYEVTPFTFSKTFQVNSKDKPDDYTKYLMMKQYLKSAFASNKVRMNLTSPFSIIDGNSTDIYRFSGKYNFSPAAKDKKTYFCVVKLNYYNNKGIESTETFRIYSAPNDKESLLDYFFMAPKGTTFMNIEISQPDISSCAFSIRDCAFYKYPEVKPHLNHYYLSEEKDQAYDIITQVFEFDNRNITRTIRSNLTSNKIEVNLKIKYKDEVQTLKEYEPIDIDSNSIEYVGRDMKLHNSIGNNNIYTTDYTTPYFSRFGNNVLYCFNGYTSVETQKEGSQYRVNIFDSNYNDQKYFIIGDGGVYKYIFTQKFNAGNESSMNYSILLDYKGPVFMPSRTPFATRGTLVITHHPDSNTINTLKATMFGSSDTKSPLYMHAGFLYHKIPATWGFFSKTEGNLTGIDNPAFKQVITAMNENGIEVVPHTITGIAPNNTRAVLEEYMPELQKMGIDDWIDHSLASGTKCADIKSEGSIAGSSQFSMDLFKKYGFKYCWSYVDVNLQNGIDMLSDDKDVSHPQIFFKNNNLGYDDYSLYQWNTYRPRNFIQEVNSSNLNELVKNAGVCLIHDYFNHPMQTGKFFTMDSKGNVTLTPKFEAVLKLIDSYRSNKKLYVPTVRQFIDYSSSLHNIDVSYDNPDNLVINNRNKNNIDGFTLITIDSTNHEKYTAINLHPGYNDISLNTFKSAYK